MGSSLENSTSEETVFKIFNQNWYSGIPRAWLNQHYAQLLESGLERNTLTLCKSDNQNTINATSLTAPY